MPIAGFTITLENSILDQVLRNQAYSPPTTMYIGLDTTAPDSNDENGVEVTTLSGSNYVRQAITFAAASGGECLNNAEVAFPVAGYQWGTVLSFRLWTQQTGGTAVARGATNIFIDVGDQYKIPAGQLAVSMSRTTS